MVAIDTNIIVRLLTRDDETQYKKALALFEKYDIFIADTVILETEWVLRYAYHFEQDSICNSFKKVLAYPISISQIRHELRKQSNGMEMD